MKAFLSCGAGLSPRGRGNLTALISQDEARCSRSIPAWAGEPLFCGILAAAHYCAQMINYT